MKAIETEYAGCRFRSRLEARWAVFFDAAGIPWKYEPEGFELSTGRYLPDFYLPECDTWIEVKGDPRRLDVDQMASAGVELPRVGPLDGGEPGPALMILGDVPEPLPHHDYGWWCPKEGQRAGFGYYAKNRRPWYLDGGDSRSWCFENLPENWLTPTREVSMRSVNPAYRAARTARFEHGETPIRPRRPTLGEVRRSRMFGRDFEPATATGEVDPGRPF